MKTAENPCEAAIVPARADQKNVKRSVRDGFRPEALYDRPDKANAKPDKKYASKSVDPAAETAVAIAIIVNIYRNMKNIEVKNLDELKD